MNFHTLKRKVTASFPSIENDTYYYLDKYFKEYVDEAYRIFLDESSARGAYCVPMTCHYRLLDTDGNILFTSEPETLGEDIETRLIFTPSRFRGSGPDYEISRKLWRLDLDPDKMIPRELRRKVTKIEVYATPLIDAKNITKNGSYAYHLRGDEILHLYILNPQRGFTRKSELIETIDVTPSRLIFPEKDKNTRRDGKRPLRCLALSDENFNADKKIYIEDNYYLCITKLLTGQPSLANIFFKNSMSRLIPTLALMALTAASCSKQTRLNYPVAPSDQTVDNYFGHEVPDPYRPLENDTAAATLAWVQAENDVTQKYLSQIPFRKNIRQRLEQLNNYPKIGMPTKFNDGKYYFYKNDGLQNQYVLYRSDTPDGEGEVFLDPNKLSDDGTVALTGVFQSHDGRYTAYTISRSGSDWTEIYVLDSDTGQLLDDHIEWAKFTGAAWQGDGFYYSAYDKPADGKEFSNANEYHKVYYHKLGTPQSDDKVIYENPNQPLHFHSVDITDDESTLIIMGGGAGNGNSLYIKDLTNPNSQWVTVEESQDNDISVIDSRDGKLYIFTSADAPRYRLVTADIKAPQRSNWKELVPERNDAVLVGARFAGDKMILTYDKDASHHAYVYNTDGSVLREISLPGYGTLAFSTDSKSPEAFYSFSSFTSPATIVSYNVESGESQPFRFTELQGFNPDDYITEQVFYPSTDGTKIPMFLTYKKGLQRDGKNPVYLYGYGGFNITLNPSFSPNRLLWLENGGIYAQTNLRGGGEYGEDWHLAGTKQQKLNVFNDFISAAEYMINEGWTNPDLIAIEGGSNGGLLVGAVTNMRPDLFRVAIPRVGVMDMMRYHLFTIGWNWAHDYGTSADSPEMAEYLLAYSPIHNIKNDGTPYPAIMVTTADHDDRVVPAHSFKYAATLQAAETGDQPKLIRIDSKAGHGAGKPVAKVIDEYADIYSFILYNMGLQPVEK